MSILLKPYRLFIFVILYQLFLRSSVALCEIWNPIETVASLLICEPLENNPLSENDNGVINYPKIVTTTAELLISKDDEEDERFGKDTAVLLNETQFYQSLREKYTIKTIPFIDTLTIPTPQRLFDNFSVLEKATRNHPQYYVLFLGYAKEEIPNALWSSSMEEMEAGKSGIIYYLDNMDKLISFKDPNDIINLIKLKAAISTYNVLQVTGSLDKTQLWGRIFTGQMTEYANYYQRQQSL